MHHKGGIKAGAGAHQNKVTRCFTDNVAVVPSGALDKTKSCPLAQPPIDPILALRQLHTRPRPFQCDRNAKLLPHEWSKVGKTLLHATAIWADLC